MVRLMNLMIELAVAGKHQHAHEREVSLMMKKEGQLGCHRMDEAGQEWIYCRRKRCFDLS
jgi:hypothetical protein